MKTNLIPGLSNQVVAVILAVEALLVLSWAADYSPGIGILGLGSVLIVGYLHLTIVPDKIFPFVKGLGPEGHPRERRWLILTGPIMLTSLASLPVVKDASGDVVGVDGWKALLWASLWMWGLLEGVVRIRF